MTQILTNPGGAFGLPTVTNAGVNNQFSIRAINNSGTMLRHGDVVVYDNNTALSTVTPVTVSGAQTALTTSFTLTAGASTASYLSAGALIVPATLSGTAPANPVPLFISYTGISGSTFTGCKAHIASVTSGLADGATIYPYPSAVAGISGWNGNYTQSVAAQPAAPFDGGRYVTLSQTGAVRDPLVAGVVTVDGTAATTQGNVPQPNFPKGSVPPGGSCLVVVAGVARVQINATTCTAGNLLTSDITPGGATNATQGTLGNMLGVALEANTPKDSNNTVRMIVKLG